MNIQAETNGTPEALEWVAPTMYLTDAALSGAIVKTLMYQKFDTFGDHSYAASAASLGRPVEDFIAFPREGAETPLRADVIFATLALCEVSPVEFVNLADAVAAKYAKAYKVKLVRVNSDEGQGPFVPYKGIVAEAENVILDGEE